LNNSVGALFVTAAGIDIWRRGERELALPRHREINEYKAKAILREAEGAEP